MGAPGDRCTHCVAAYNFIGSDTRGNGCVISRWEHLSEPVLPCRINALMLFLPLLLYDCVRMRSWKAGVITGAGVLCQMVWFVQGEIGVFRFVLWCFTLILAAIFSVRTERSLKLAQEVIHLKDSSTELRLAMQKRQQDLLEKQDYEIHLATLQERNRIAREIHDNVGHMLSRSILQMGALQTIHKEEPLHEQLVAINDTLSQAMNNIRESVHDLHNESLDLKQALREVTDEFRDKYEIAFTYDMSAAVPRNVKYCFLAITKESLAMLCVTAMRRVSVCIFVNIRVSIRCWWKITERTLK